MIVALGGVAQDARRAATDWIAGVVPGDTLVTSIRPIGSDEPVAAELAASPGVARVSPIATFEAAFRGLRLDAAAPWSAGTSWPTAGSSFVGGDRTAALNALDEGGSTIVPDSLARTLGLRVGDEMAFPVGAGHEVRLRVVGIVERSIPGRTGESVLVGWPDATDGFGVSGADAFAVRFEPGCDGRGPGRARRRSPAATPSRRTRSTGSPERSTRPSPGSSGCSMRWRSWRCSWPPSGS